MTGDGNMILVVLHSALYTESLLSSLKRNGRTVVVGYGHGELNLNSLKCAVTRVKG